MQKEIKYGGFSATPDEYNSPDGDLAGMVNLVNEQGALHPVLPPKEKFTIPAGCKILMIHDSPAFNGDVHYIMQDGDNNLYWALENNMAGKTKFRDGYGFAVVNQMNSVGNTLVALTDNGMYYFLWNGTGYTNLGQKIPEVDISFSLRRGFASKLSDETLDDSTWGQYTNNNDELTGEKKTQYNNLLHGLANKMTAEEVTGKGKFNEPFFVRYAIRLYDGSLVMHSAPVLMLPQTLTCALYSEGVNQQYYQLQVYSGADMLELQALVPSGNWAAITDWKDLITSVDIFISVPIYTYNQAKDIDHIKGPHYALSFISGYIPQGETGYWYEPNHNGGSAGVTVINDATITPQHDLEEWKQSVRDCQNFYLLKSIRIENLRNYNSRNVIVIPDDYLQSLTSREVMTDDYNSHDTIIPKCSYNYNGRLNVANIIRKLYKGHNPFDVFTWSNSGSGAKVTIYVDIVSDGKTVTVERKARSEYNGMDLTLHFATDGLVYFYYPDPNAKRAVVKLGSTCYEMKLQPHVGLNGAFFFDMDGVSTTTTAPVPSSDDTISMPNKIYSSEVNNPFFFPLLGINTVGTGEILGICAAVKAMSQGQFGQFPLYSFTTEGVWALQVTINGGFSAVQPVTRDVCIDPDSITQMDDAVLFVTDRGIMLISGSQSQCISEIIDSRDAFTLSAMSDKPAITSALQVYIGTLATALELVTFKVFMRDARMIYDYVHQRIIVYNPSMAYAYIYALESHKWGMMVSNLADHINSYPESLAVTSDGKMINLCEEDTDNDVPFALVTRPIKLGDADIIKTVNTVIQRGYFDHGDVKSAIFGTRDLTKPWQLIHSSNDHFLRGFSGTGYKYFRIVLFGNLDPDKSITGTTIQFEPRHTNRLR